MAAAHVTDFFLALCERTDNSIDVELDGLAVGEALGIHAPTVFAHVNELKVRGWIADGPSDAFGGLRVHLTAAGTSRPVTIGFIRGGVDESKSLVNSHVSHGVLHRRCIALARPHTIVGQGRHSRDHEGVWGRSVVGKAGFDGDYCRDIVTRPAPSWCRPSGRLSHQSAARYRHPVQWRAGHARWQGLTASASQVDSERNHCKH